MDIKAIFDRPESEKPLDKIVDDGGFTSLFRKIAIVGDSLASGELESMDFGSPRDYHDYFDISWGQYLARMAGTTVYNFTRGGMSAKEFCDGFAHVNGYWSPDKAAQAYICALGCNDLDNMGMDPGSIEDVAEDWHYNKPTYAGYFARIIQHYKQIQPDAYFFLLTHPREPEEIIGTVAYNNHIRQREIMYSFAEKFTNTYVIDLMEYGPDYDAEFRKLFFTGGHLNSAGYYLTAKMVGSYIDYIVRHDMEKFNQCGFIGTGFKYVAQ